MGQEVTLADNDLTPRFISVDDLHDWIIPLDRHRQATTPGSEIRSLLLLPADLGPPSHKPASTSLPRDRTGVGTEHWRRTLYLDGEELYDHGSDPTEGPSLADDPEHATKNWFPAGLAPEEPFTAEHREVSRAPGPPSGVL